MMQSESSVPLTPKSGSIPRHSAGRSLKSKTGQGDSAAASGKLKSAAAMTKERKSLRSIVLEKEDDRRRDPANMRAQAYYQTKGDHVENSDISANNK